MKKNDSFAREMAKIGQQAEAERLAEIKAEQRRALYGKIRKVMLALALVVFTGVAYQQREVITVQAKTIAAKAGLGGGNGKSLTGYSEANQKLNGQVGELQAVAAQRTQLIDEIAAGTKPAVSAKASPAASAPTAASVPPASTAAK